ncbi:hypothetical protein LTR84_001398 [Exophiala bonariae]|uniref:Carboxymuconolactone decarboxylase-like domain-containing protein n=1 Tax=Exophiala bonariae TaxID=1690606 RepID=A0AAV9NDE3_9EURO|nr:hypothetical protein LTR84_001398 [Exophiala bonariae]
MSEDFASRYTLANIPRNAAPYQTVRFLDWLERLKSVGMRHDIALGVMVAILTGQRRGDAASNLFKHVTAVQNDEIVKELFVAVREAIAIASPFVGLPNTMPANFGIIAVLKDRGIASIESKSRANFAKEDYEKIGHTTSQAIYRGVGNKEVGQMLAQYMPDFSTYNTFSIFGYLCGGSTVFSLAEVETIVVSAIIGLGATRQARSHTKAAMQLGISVEILSTIDAVAQQIAAWNKTPLPEVLDLAQLRNELSSELEKLATC